MKDELRKIIDRNELLIQSNKRRGKTTTPAVNIEAINNQLKSLIELRTCAKCGLLKYDTIYYRYLSGYAWICPTCKRILPGWRSSV